MKSKTKTLLIDELVAELEPADQPKVDDSSEGQAASRTRGRRRKSNRDIPANQTAQAQSSPTLHSEDGDIDEKTRHAVESFLQRSSKKQNTHLKIVPPIANKSATTSTATPNIPAHDKPLPAADASPHPGLVQAEHLRLAQERILKLEHEAERLRDDNEALSAAGQALQKHTHQLEQQVENKSAKLEKLKNSLANENKMLESSMKFKTKQINDLSLQLQQYELRLNKNRKKIRTRERELENRLEIMKLETAALVQTKDKNILDLKKQVDRMNDDMDSFQNKQSELTQMIDAKKDLLNRIERTLKMALSLVTGDSDTKAAS